MVRIPVAREVIRSEFKDFTAVIIPRTEFSKLVQRTRGIASKKPQKSTTGEATNDLWEEVGELWNWGLSADYTHPGHFGD